MACVDAAVPAQRLAEAANAPPGPVRGDDYRKIQDVAHLRPPPVIYPPLFVWHTVLWKEVGLPPAEDADRVRRERLEAIDAFLLELFEKFSKPEIGDRAFYGVESFDVSPCDAGIPRRFGPKSRARDGEPSAPEKANASGHTSGNAPLVYYIRWLCVMVTLRFEVHTEFSTLTAYLDFSLKGGAKGAPQGPPNKNQAKACRELKKIVTALRVLNSLAGTCPPRRSGEYKKFFDVLYSSPRRLVFDYLLKPLDVDRASRPLNIDQFGKPIADFRGLILSPDRSTSSDGIQSKGAVFQQPFYRIATQESEPAAAPSWPASAWTECLRKFWPFLTVPSVDDIDIKKFEFSVSRVLGSRALMVTALGVQPPEPEKSAPLYYFVFSSSNDGRQIGRLVDTLSLTGTARVTALKSLSSLRDASEHLKVAETVITQTIKEVFAIRPKGTATSAAAPAGETRRDEREEDELEQITRQLKTKLATIGQHMAQASNAVGGESFKDELENRVERSRYYVRKFRGGIPALRITRLEGYLPYHDFVERRLGSDYEFMDLLAVRLQRTRADITLLNQMGIALRSEQTQRRIQGLQEAAEAALLAALLPYYLGHIIIEGIFQMKEGWLRALLWLAIWLLGVVAALRRSDTYLAKFARGLRRRGTDLATKAARHVRAGIDGMS